jgi:restriction endonuclease Mrr
VGSSQSASLVRELLRFPLVSRCLHGELSTTGDRVPIPDFQTLMLPVLRIAAEGEVRVSDVVDRLAAEFALSPEERSHLLPSGTKTTFSNRIHWVKSHLGKAGLVELTKRAHFRITDQGREVLAGSPERIDIKYLNRFPSYQQSGEPTKTRRVGLPRRQAKQPNI